MDISGQPKDTMSTKITDYYRITRIIKVKEASSKMTLKKLHGSIVFQ